MHRESKDIDARIGTLNEKVQSASKRIQKALKACGRGQNRGRVAVCMLQQDKDVKEKTGKRADVKGGTEERGRSKIFMGRVDQSCCVWYDV